MTWIGYSLEQEIHERNVLSIVNQDIHSIYVSDDYYAPLQVNKNTTTLLGLRLTSE
jgi:hypothetical protein